MPSAPRPWFNRRRRIALSLLAIVIAYVAIATAREHRRIATVFPHTETAPATELDHARLLADLANLADPAFEGRRTGEPGGIKARQWVESRFREIGLETIPPTSPSFTEPFAFDHRSIRALWRRDRPFMKHFADAANVVGTIQGTAKPESYIVVSAHYDHLGVRNGQVYPGADDNASGIATLLALASYFKAHPPRHSLLFAAFDAEELGLRGAKAFVAHPPVPLADLRVDVNLDMVSRSATGDLFVTGLSDHPKFTPAVTAAAARSTVHLHAGHDRSMLRAGRVEDWRHGSDHGAFLDAGVPYLYLGVEDHEDYHRPTDTVDKIDPRFFEDVAELVREVVVQLDASLDAAP